MPLITKMWLSYAKQSLEQLSELLLAADTPESPPT
jgi:hypothetical protein